MVEETFGQEESNKEKEQKRKNCFMTEGFSEVKKGILSDKISNENLIGVDQVNSKKYC